MITKSFTAVGNSLLSRLEPGARAAYRVNGTYVGVVTMERMTRGHVGTNPQRNTSGTLISATSVKTAGFIVNDTARAQDVRFVAALDGATPWSGTAVCALVDVPASAIKTGVGAASGATVMAFEAGDAVVHQTSLVFTNTPLTLLMASRGGGLKVYDFPEGRIRVLGAVGSLAMITTSILADTLNASKTANWGIGSTIQATPTLATTEQNILPTTAITSSATIDVTGAVSKSGLVAAIDLDGTTAAAAAILNVGVETAADIDAEATVVVNGGVTISWVNLGDV